MTEEQVLMTVVKAIKEAQSQSQSVLPWYQQYNIVNLSLVAAVGYFVWSAKTFFETFTGSIKDLYEKYHNTTAQLNHLQGSHDSIHGDHPCRRKEDHEQS